MKLPLYFLVINFGLILACNNLCKLHLSSPQASIFYNYFPFINNRVEFQIRSAGPVRILLSNDYAPNLNPNYEFVIGYNGTRGMHLFRDGTLVTSNPGATYDPKTFRRFEVTIVKGYVRLITNVDMLAINYGDIINVPMQIVGVAAGSNVNAELLYDCRQFIG